MCKNRYFCAANCFLIFGIVGLFLLGVIVPVVLEKALPAGLDEQTILSPAAQSQNSEAWRWFVDSDDGAPLHYFKVYFLNVTNAEAYINGQSPKPLLQEVGPYGFVEVVKRTNVEFSSDVYKRKTLSFNEWKTYRWDPSLSGAGLSLEDSVTTLNLVFQSIVPFFETQFPGDSDQVWQLIESNYPSTDFSDLTRLFVNKTARELIFGYDDDKVPYTSKFPGIQPNITYDDAVKLGKTTICTGEDDPSLVGQTIAWKGSFITKSPELMIPNSPALPIWGSNTPFANRVFGTNGEKFRRNLEKESSVQVFDADAMRTVLLTNIGGRTIDLNGVRLLKMITDPSVLQNISENPNNEDFYMNGPSGFYNLTRARSNVPIYVSLPHFFNLNNAEITDKIDGLQPNADKHELFVGVEPISGLTMNARKRSQINFIVGPSPKFVNGDGQNTTWFAHLQQSTYFPVCWLEEGGSASDLLIKKFKSQVYTAEGLLLYGRWIGGVCGTLMLIASAFFMYKSAVVQQRSLFEYTEHLVQ
jgi:hypothetical protein